MRNVWISLGLALGFASYAGAEFAQPAFNGEITGGYRKDNFSWSMSGTHNSPEELWEMDWNDLEILESTARFSYTSCNNYTTRINGGYGIIRSGQCKARANAKHKHFHRVGEDSSSSSSSSSRNRGGAIDDPAFNTLDNTGRPLRDHHGLYSRINGDAKNGHVIDVQGGFGYQVTSNGRRFVATPMVGYAFRELRLDLRKAKQLVNRIDVPIVLGDIPDLNFRYKPRVQGFWVGLDFEVMVEVPCVILFGSVEYHWDQYRATGNWRLGDQFSTSFKDKTSGTGMIAYLGANYRLGSGWYIGVIGYYRNWHGERGKHSTKSTTNTLANPNQVFGTIPVTGSGTHLNRIKWNSWSAAITLTYRIWDF